MQQETSSLVSVPEQTLRRKAAAMLDSVPYTVFITIVILVSVFAWDFAEGWLPAAADGPIEILMTITLVLFAVELLLMVYTIDRWWKSWSFWICFIATAAMIFDVPWLQKALFGTGVAGGTLVSNLRLIKIIRVLARVGRLMRVLKSLLVSRVRLLLARVLHKRDVDAMIKERVARQQITDSSGSQLWKALETATTIGITAIISAIFVVGVLYIGAQRPDSAPEAVFHVIARMGKGLELAEEAERFVQEYPSVVELRIGEREFASDSERLAVLRPGDIERYAATGAELVLDIRSFTQPRARSYALFTGLIFLGIAAMVVFLNWAIIRFSMELSGALKTLAHALDERDPYTRMHSYHVSVYSARISEHLGLGKEDQKIARIAGELHDIGKIGVPENILRKQGKLTDEEYEIMKQHTNQGAKILNPLTDFDAVILGVRHHHEKYNGKGYPDGLSGNSIPRIARVLAVCDVWDALTTDRPYRASMSFEEARDILLSQKNTELDGEMVDAFLDAYDDIQNELAQAKAAQAEAAQTGAAQAGA